MKLEELAGNAFSISEDDINQAIVALAAYGRIEPRDPSTQLRLATWLASNKGLRGAQLQQAISEIVNTMDATFDRLEKLIGYYIDGWGGFPENPDRYTKSIMDAIQHLDGKDPYSLTPEEFEMANDILDFGSDVSDEELENY